MLKIPNCRNFTGYKPCFQYYNCLENGCKEHKNNSIFIIIINLDAMGDVLLSTSHLSSLKNKYPDSIIWWITKKVSVNILLNNPYIDKVLEYNFESINILYSLQFSIAVNLDKSLDAASILKNINSETKLGFSLNEFGKIIPINKGAEYNYKLGLDDNLKFKINTKTKQQYVAETLEIPEHKNEYIFNLFEDEISFIEDYKSKNGLLNSDKIIGFNTGCSTLFPNKKMTVEQHKVLIKALIKESYKIILLGGPEDTERNNLIADGFSDIINSPTNLGVRIGAALMSIPDIVITGDSFGMHLAIAFKKYVIAWFGLSCWEEIELFNRGVKIIPKGLECAPCWKKECPYNLECIQMIDLDRILTEINIFFSKK